MPELPEVETVAVGLRKKIIGETIRTFTYERSFAGKIEPSPLAVKKFLLGKSIIAVERKGKLLLLRLEETAKTLLIHLKMTGQLVYVDREKTSTVVGGHPISLVAGLPNKFTRWTLGFGGERRLFFNDVRKFGYLKLADERAVAEALARFGVEPLSAEWTLAYFESLVARFPRQKIKNLLLNQTVIAGLGNIYADEACFRAGVLPTRLVGTLSPSARRAVWSAARSILRDGIKYGGTTFSDYCDSSGHSGAYQKKLMVYGRNGELCKKCRREKIIKIKINGRSSCYCRRCQV